jgi:hypothetical protein
MARRRDSLLSTASSLYFVYSVILFIFTVILFVFNKIYKESFQTRTPIYQKLTRIYMPYEYIAPSYNSSLYPSAPRNFVNTFELNINSATYRHTIQDKFISFSFETPQGHIFLSDMYGNRRVSFTNLMNTFRTMNGSSIGPHIRLGAGQGHVRYNPTNKTHKNYLDTYKYINNFNGSLSFQLPLTQQSPVNPAKTTFSLPNNNDLVYASNVVTYLKNTLGFSTLIVELGNEPDYIMFNTDDIQENSNVAYSNYITRMNAYVNVLNPIVGSNIIIGSFASPNQATSWGSQFINNNLASFKNKVKYLSAHHYTGCDCGGDRKYKDGYTPTNGFTPQVLLDRTYNVHLSLEPVVDRLDMEYHLGETNSICCSGQFGVSDTFAAALWIVDYTLYAKYHNVKRMNFHNHIIPNGVYTIVSYPDAYRSVTSEIVNVKPSSHGLLLLYYILRNRGNIYRIEDPNQSNTLRRWVIKSSTEWNIVFLHMKSSEGNIRVELNKLTNNNKPAKLFRLVCQTDISAKNGISFAGLTFEGTTDGNLRNCRTNATVPHSSLNSYLNSSSNYETVNLISNKYTFIVGKTSAVVLTIPL